jgi:GT2 family glycosyltransferase
VTVVDNSGDFEHDVRIVRPEGNLGFTGAANVALREWLRSEEPYCVVAAHDLHVEPGTLRKLVSAAQARPQYGVLGPNLTPQGVHGDLIGFDGHVETRDMVSGACLLLKRDCIAEIGLFDEEFGTYTEDREICLRAIDHGWQVGRVLAATAITLGRGSPDAALMYLPNHVLLEWKRNGWGGAGRKLAEQLARLLRHALVPWSPAHRRMFALRARVFVLAVRKIWSSSRTRQSSTAHTCRRAH